MDKAVATNELTDAFVEQVQKRLDENRRVRVSLAVEGLLNIERQLPFLCVYRKPRTRADGGTEKLVTGESSYLIVRGRARARRSHAALVRNIATTLGPRFGAFLLIEIWTSAGEAIEAGAAPEELRPGFVIHAPKTRGLEPTIEELVRSLKRFAVQKQRAGVAIARGGKCSPPGLGDLLSNPELKQLGCFLIGIEVKPIHQDPETGQVHPLVLRKLERAMARALKRAVYEFSHSLTTHTPPHYQALGRHAIRKLVWNCDRQLAQISDSFDFLLTLTPINAEQSWAAFKRSRFSQAPEFLYRPVPIEPELVKRELYRIPLEKIEDPVLAHLFRDKQDELDRQITMLADRRRAQFLYGSLQVFGGADERMLGLAKELLARLPPHSHEASGGRNLTAEEFAQRAMVEIERFRKVYPKLWTRVEVRSDTIGLMVSRGNLLIGQQTKVPESRVEALIQHEIGTHVVTYFNGRLQPLKQLYAGLSGYEELQEGLAVLAEYLVGGLSKPRLRLLAGRVIAVRCLTEGATFIDTFRELHDVWGFAEKSAFSITTRVYRGGGLTKDVVYFRGLNRILEYISEKKEIDQLYIGKIGFDHITIAKELQWRKVIRPAKLRPSYLDDGEAMARLADLRKGRTVLDLIGEEN